jgi:hypothetical protein
MRRRSLMAMLGLAPIAGASGALSAPTPKVVGLRTMSGVALDGLSLSEPVALKYNSPEDDVPYAEKQLNLLRWKQKNGFGTRPNNIYDCPNIESRRATSPAVKRILHAQNRDRLEMQEAERSVAYHTAIRLAPEWLRRFL